MNDLGLKDKVAIVTGAGGGIGREIALALANEGVKILANDIGVSLSGEGGSIQPAEETCGLITQKGGEAIPDTNSVSSWSSATKIIQNALDNFKQVVHPSQIDIKKDINKIGQFPITINLHSDLIAELRVSVEKKTLKK